MRDTFRLDASQIDLFRALIDVFGTAFEATEVYCGAQPDDAYLGALLDRDDFIALVARQDGRVVGGLAAYVLHKFERRRSEIYIYDLAVSEAFRRSGVATRLIEELRTIARQIGAYVIFVQADHGDDTAVALYSRLGSREDVLHFDIAP